MLHERSKAGESSQSSDTALSKKEKLEKKRADARAWYHKNKKRIKAMKKKSQKQGRKGMSEYVLARRLSRMVGERLRDGEELNELYITAFLLTQRILNAK